MLKSKILLFLSLGLVIIQTIEVDGMFVRFYVCDNGCPMDECGEEPEDEESKVCAHIIETDPNGEFITFPNKCAFDCANKCYEHQLKATPGACGLEQIRQNLAPSGGELKPNAAGEASKKQSHQTINAVDEDENDLEDSSEEDYSQNSL